MTATLVCTDEDIDTICEPSLEQFHSTKENEHAITGNSIVFEASEDILDEIEDVALGTSGISLLQIIFIFQWM